jgi:3-oxoadipate enol-lactonase
MKVNIGNFHVNIESSGNTDGPVVMMAHSLGCSLRMWDPQLEILEADFHVVRLDMRGHGDSDAPEGPYSLDDLADDVIAVMDHVKIKQAHWAGLSIGGMIGQSLLLRYPDRFLSAALCDTMAALPEGAMDISRERIAKVEADGLGSIKQATLERWFTADFLAGGNSGIDAVGAQIDQASDTGYLECSRAITKLDFINQLSGIDTPVLLIVGAEDMATPVAASQAMHDRLPRSELVVLQNASHISNVEQADAFNAALGPFLRHAAGLA